MYSSPIVVKGNSHFGSNFWDAYSPKLKRDVNFYSDLEYEHWVLVETDSKVASFCEQPLLIEGIYQGEKSTSIFDMWILWSNGVQEFVEIKYTKDMMVGSKQYKRVKKQITLQEEWCKINNLKYSVKTELDIRRNLVYLNNKKTILPYLNVCNVPTVFEINMINKVLSSIPKKIVLIEKELPSINKNRLREILYHLIYQESIKSNIQEKILGYETEVWKGEL